MITILENPFPDGNCFFCGPNNPSGLQLTFQHDTETDEVLADYIPTAQFCGQGEIFHGGLQMGLLDELMWWAGYVATGVMEAVTMRANFKFLRPVYIGKPLRAVCHMIKQEGNDVRLRGKIFNSAGKICTAVTGTYRIVDRAQYERMLAENR